MTERSVRALTPDSHLCTSATFRYLPSPTSDGATVPATRKTNPMVSKQGGRASTRRGGRIALNGRYLDEVRTRLHSPTESGRVSYLCLPEEHHRAIPDGDGFILRTPAITALQLHHEGLLSAGHAHPVELAIDDQAYGTYLVDWLRREPDHSAGTEMVLLRLAPTPASHTATNAGRQWSDELVPLRLEPHGMWDPEEEYWGEEHEPIEEWAKAIIARGPRPSFEMEQVLPGSDPDDPNSDPIIEANTLRDVGRMPEARRLLLRLIEQDPRCLDAHAHLGNLEFDKDAERALAHYATGVTIGRSALGKGFVGVLPWRLIDNRPFLRCLQGYGLCLWRLGQFEEAERVFDQLLWLNPTDNLGVRFLLRPVRRREKWRDDIV